MLQLSSAKINSMLMKILENFILWIHDYAQIFES